MNIQSIENTIQNAMEVCEVPGLSVALIHNDQIIYARGFGVATLGSLETVDENSLYAVASITKSTVATSLAMLIDEGKLHWDDKVTDYLPGFQLYDPYATREIRIRDLLIHNCGLAEVSGGTIWYGSSFSRQEVVKRLRYLQPATSFRSTFAYQNVMFLVASEIIPVVSGLTWDQFVQQRIFAPLGMNRSTTCLPELKKRDNVATPHARIAGKVQPIAYRNHDNVGPAASINSSVWDWAQYLRLQLGRGTFQGTQLFSRERSNEMWQAQMVAPQHLLEENLPERKPIFRAYGLGWFIQDYQGHWLISHSGGVDGMRGFTAMLPEDNFGLVIFSNQEAGQAYYAAAYTILDDFLGLPNIDWIKPIQKVVEAQKQKQQSQPKPHQLDTLPSHAIADYSGTYFDPKVGDILITVEKDDLKMSFANNPLFSAQLKHWHYDTFEIIWQDPYFPNGLLTFTFNSHGKIDGIKLDQPNLLDVDFSELEIVRYPIKKENFGV